MAFICSSVVKATLSVFGFPTGQATPLRAILVSLAWSDEENWTQQVDLILSIQKSSMDPVLFSISWNDLTVKGLVRFVMTMKFVSFFIFCQCYSIFLLHRLVFVF